MFGIVGNPANLTNLWHALLGKIFEVEVQELTQEDVRKYFLEHGKIDIWKKKTYVERLELKIE